MEVVNEDFVSLGYKTPEHKKNKTTFIEQLQEERMKDELEITSPYDSTNTSTSLHSLSFQFISSLKDLSDTHFLNSSNQIDNDDEKSLGILGCECTDPSVTVPNKTSAKSS